MEVAGGEGPKEAPESEAAPTKNEKKGKRTEPNGNVRQSTIPETEHNRCLKIIYFNARSIGNKLDELQALANERDPDFILITESWCNDKTSNGMLNIEGYNVEPELRIDRVDTANGIGGGLLVYSKKGIVLKPENNL